MEEGRRIEEMERYHKDSSCLKCGMSGAETFFVPAGQKEADGSYLDIESMRRTCCNCGYRWYERPLY
jgi:hypothetical protein